MKYPLSSILQEERKDMTIRECYEKTGSDYESILEAKDGERAFRAAHTLKGVCINLGFDRLYNVSAELTEKLRGREIEESEELFEQVEKEYHALTAVLKQYESEL